MKSYQFVVIFVCFVTFSIGVFSRAELCIAANNSSFASYTSGKTRTIKIACHRGKKLCLEDESGKDASSLDANDDDVIVWDNRDADIVILKIKQKFLRKNRFLKRPAFQSTPDRFEGQLQNYNGKDRSQHYFITWKYKNGKKHKYDPLIRINPTQPIE